MRADQVGASSCERGPMAAACHALIDLIGAEQLGAEAPQAASAA